MNTRDILILAKEKIANRDNWTQGANCRDNVGDRLIGHRTANAVSWCAVGAIYAVAGGMSDDAVVARRALHSALPKSDVCVSVTRYNDSHTHTEVLELFDRAIINCV